MLPIKQKKHNNKVLYCMTKDDHINTLNHNIQLLFMTIAILNTILMNKQIHDCFKNCISTPADIARDRNSDAYTFKDDVVLKTSSN